MQPCVRVQGVLILVLVDVGLGRPETMCRRTSPRPVLILVLVDVGLGPLAVAGSHGLGFVLILVLVDVGLGRCLDKLVKPGH